MIAVPIFLAPHGNLEDQYILSELTITNTLKGDVSTGEYVAVLKTEDDIKIIHLSNWDRTRPAHELVAVALPLVIEHGFSYKREGDKEEYEHPVENRVRYNVGKHPPIRL